MSIALEKPQTSLATRLDLSLLALRLGSGSVFFFHGAGKLLGWFGGPGLAAMTAAPPNGMGPVLGSLVSVGECLGGLAVLVGLLSRFSSFWHIVIMLGAIGMVHGAKGFSLQGGGFEYNMALIAMALPVLLVGPGRLALAHFLPAKLKPFAG